MARGTSDRTDASPSPRRVVPERFRVGITRYQPSDAKDLHAFQLRMFGAGTPQVDPARFAWLYDRNPCRSPEGPGLWICRRDGDVVGQQCEFRFELSIRGQLHPAAWAADLMVDEAWRMRGVGPALVDAQAAEHRIGGGVNINPGAHRMYLRGGWADLGVVPVYVRPLDWRRASQIAPTSPRRRRLLRVAAPALRAFDLALAAAARASRTRLVAIDRFDERVDAVWHAAAPDYPVLARRDAAVLPWKLDERFDHDQLRRFYLVRRDRVLGYVVLRPDETQDSKQPITYVDDYLAPRRLVVPLLAHAARRARADGSIALVNKTLNPGVDQRLRACGFVRRDQGLGREIRFMIHCSEDAELCEVLHERRNWLITAADII